MSKPKKVEVSPFRYTVYYSPVTLDDKTGMLDTDTRTVVVDGTISEQSQQEVLLHELLHAIIDTTAIRGQEKDEEEKLVAALSPPLLQLLRSNPTLVGFLLDRP